MKKRIPEVGQQVIVDDDLWNKKRYGKVHSLLGTQFSYLEDGADCLRYVFYTDNNWREYEPEKR